MTATKTGSTERWVNCGQGHEHWGAEGAAGLLLRHTDDQGRVRYLLQHRAAWVDHGNTWGIPGGAIEQGETPIKAALREAEEETGSSLPSHITHVRTYTDDHGGGWAYHTVICDTDDDSVTERTHEQQGTRWVTSDEMRSLPLHPGFEATWSKVKQGSKTAASLPESEQ